MYISNRMRAYYPHELQMRLATNRIEVFQMWDKIALTLLIIGGINWGLVGIFEFDLVAWLFGGSDTLLSRAVYIVVAVCAVWCSTLLFRLDDEPERVTSSVH